MTWLFALLVLAGLMAVVRVVMAVRKTQRHQDDWDERLVKNLRAQGGNAFTPYEVDFFFNLPDEAGSAALRVALESEGFSVETHPMRGEAATGLSLHASKRLRVNVDDMQEYSRRFRELAAQYGGYYDGWMTDPSRT
jgi:hypothetical protein